MTDERPYSSIVVDGVEQAPSRAMLYPVGFTEADFKKTANRHRLHLVNGHPPATCILISLPRRRYAALMRLALRAFCSTRSPYLTAFLWAHPGMRYSLASREVIADSIETVVGAQGFDGFVAIGGCDKNMPACGMAIARMNRPAVFVYGGTILPGEKRRDVVSVFEAVGQHAAGNLSDIQLKEVEATAIPGPGSCGGMYTANTMASALEALGLSLPNSSAQNAVSQAKKRDSYNAGAAVRNLIKLGMRPSDMLSLEAFENAITITIALEGSTNAVLHLLAIAHSANIKLELDDFTRIGKRVPVLADMRPAGSYSMSELIEIGGIEPLMKTLLNEGLLHGDCLTVTGNTLAENLKDVPDYPATQKIIRPLSNPIKKDSHLVILRGNLAPEGAVAKITGHEGLSFTGKARCFHGEEAAMSAIMDGTVVAGDVVIVRYEGPKGGPGMREMLSPTSAINGRGMSDQVALLTDGRFSGGSHGFVVGHVTPEAYDGGPIALVEDGDEITIDAESRVISLGIDDSTLAKRREAWRRPAPYTQRGTLAKYAKLVTSASEGAVTDKYLGE